MKRIFLKIALLIIVLPMSVFALGLGDLKIDSYLNQPFKGEIDVVNPKNIPLSGIKVSVASYEDFERIGFEYREALHYLKFNIARNKKGQSVIKIRSDEHITEPYMELVIDVAWADGQLYRAYTVLLDPPDYSLARPGKRYSQVRTSRAGPGVVDRTVKQDVVVQAAQTETSDRTESRYGPTTGKETIWSIAQRYVASETSLPQIALAIVGANPQAFKDGNLNGLLAGKQLMIPASHQIRNIPLDLANAEVVAHDRAWADKAPIQHVLKPPYLDGMEVSIPREPEIETSKSSYIPVLEAPKDLSKESDLGTSPRTATGQPERQTVGEVPAPSEVPAAKPVGGVPSPGLFSFIENPDTIFPSIAGAPSGKTPVESEALVPVSEAPPEAPVSDSNLPQKLEQLQADNKRLEQLLQKREQELAELRVQLNELRKQRKGIAGQTASVDTDDEGISWLFILLIILLLGGGAAALWYFYIQRNEASDEGDDDERGSPEITPIPPEPDDQSPEAVKKEEEEGSESITAETRSSTLSTEFDHKASDQEMDAIIAGVIASEKDKDKQDIASKADETELDSEAKKTEHETTQETQTPVETKEASESSEAQTPEDSHFTMEIEKKSSQEETELAKPEKESAAEDSSLQTSEQAESEDDFLSPEELEQSRLHFPSKEKQGTPSEKTFSLDNKPSLDEAQQLDEKSSEASVSDKDSTALTPEQAERRRRPLEDLTYQLGGSSSSNIEESEPKGSEEGSDESPAEDKSGDSQEKDNSLEFESGLHEKDSAEETQKSEAKGDKSEESEADNSIDFSTEPEEHAATPEKDKSAKDKPASKEEDEGVIEFDMDAIDKKEDINQLAVDNGEEEIITSPFDVEDEDDDKNPNEADSQKDEKEEGSASDSDEDDEQVNEFSVDELELDEEESDLESGKDKPAKENELIKSKAGLDTLLSLAETYIGMDDMESAQQALDEVLEYGNKTQKTKAEKLLKKMNKKG